MRARDLIRIIGAGLRGAGESISDDEVAGLSAPGGAEGFVRIAVELLQATFGGPTPPGPPAPQEPRASRPNPFPGTG